MFQHALCSGIQDVLISLQFLQVLSAKSSASSAWAQIQKQNEVQKFLVLQLYPSVQHMFIWGHRIGNCVSVLRGKWQLRVTRVQHWMHHGLEGFKLTFRWEDIMLQKVGQAVLLLSCSSYQTQGTRVELRSLGMWTHQNQDLVTLQKPC